MQYVRPLDGAVSIAACYCVSLSFVSLPVIVMGVVGLNLREDP
jgi:hypothetical protein